MQKENQPSSVSSGTVVLGTVGQQRDILRVDLRVGRIVSAEKHPDADSLVNFLDIIYFIVILYLLLCLTKVSAFL